jgi:hypothetical protein
MEMMLKISVRTVTNSTGLEWFSPFDAKTGQSSCDSV